MSFTMSGAGEVKWDFNRFDKYEEQLAEKAGCGYQKGGEVKKGCDKCDGKGCEHCEGKKDAKKGEKKAKSGGSKPDYLDFDKDGDKEEPMTDALGEGVLDAALKGDKELAKLQKKADKDGKRAAKGLKFKEEAAPIQYPTGEKKKFTKDKSDPKVAAGRKAAAEMGLKKEEAEEVTELYQGKHGQSEKEYQDGRSDAGKLISGDSKGSGANYSYKAKNTGTNPAGGSQKPQGQAKMTNKDRDYLKLQKANLKKEHLELFSDAEIAALFED